MRWIGWVAGVLAACVLGDAAAGAEPVAAAPPCTSCHGAYGTASAPACCFGFFGMVPSCCETRPSCCDNVWATYCQGRAYRLQMHWMRQSARIPPVPYAQPMWGGPAGAVQPLPDTWPEDEPAPPAPLPDSDPPSET